MPLPSIGEKGEGCVGREVAYCRDMNCAYLSDLPSLRLAFPFPVKNPKIENIPIFS